MSLTRSRWFQKTVFFFSIVLAASQLCLVASLTAQDKKEEKVLPEVEDITLETKDGVMLRCSWYPGQKEKNSVPVILLHGWNGQRQEYKALAESLQKEGGCAVLVPDLRGHGESTKTKLGVQLDREKFSKLEVAAVYNDIEKCSRFLRDKNNMAELNLEMLTVVAANESAIFAIDWSIKDWSWPDFNGQKQGKNVKALVLLSPKKSFQGLALTSLCRAPLISGKGMLPLTMLIAWGTEDAKESRDISSIHNLIEKARPEFKVEGETEEERFADEFKKKTLFFLKYATDEQGTKLLESPKAGKELIAFINSFIQLKIANSELDFSWHELAQ